MPHIVAEIASNSVTTKPSLARVTTPLTDDYRRIMDSPDLLRTVAAIRANGSQDEKDWALYIVAGCINVRSAALRAAASSSQAITSNAVVEAKAKELAAEKRRAYDSASTRCKGIWDMSPEERRALNTELMAGSASNPSALGQLNALASTDETRWTSEQSGLISSALYSDDLVLQRGAFYALHGAIDVNAPGGEERREALELAFTPEAAYAPLSELDSLVACSVIGACASNISALREQSSPSRSVKRLADEYRAALQNHKDAASILAIR